MANDEKNQNKKVLGEGGEGSSLSPEVWNLSINDWFSHYFDYAESNGVKIFNVKDYLGIMNGPQSFFL